MTALAVPANAPPAGLPQQARLKLERQASTEPAKAFIDRAQDYFTSAGVPAGN
jgi:hypothetical protein